jgi:hypothetical protein
MKIAGQATIDPTIFMMALQQYEMKRYMGNFREVMASLALRQP